MQGLFNLAGKTAIVTGASTGLGQGVSLGLAEAGADIVLVDHVESGATNDLIRALGRRTLPLVADLMELSSITTIMEKTIAEFGKVDILVNNAGIIRRTPALDFSEKDWDDVMLINAKTVFFF